MNMAEEMMSTKEVADYLDIHEKQVYSLIKGKRIPCTKVTGKWLFLKKLIDEWIINNSENKIKFSAENPSDEEKSLLSSGSNDPVLDVLLNYMKQINPGFRIFSSSTGSTEGLKLLSKGITDIAWCHLYDPDTREYNIPFLSSYFKNKEVAVVHLFYRELGFLFSENSPLKPNNFNDLTLSGIKLINRQKGSGTRIFFDYNLKNNNIDAGSINGYRNEVYTHFEVGLSILSGEANTGIATVAISKLFGLNFVPLVKESFDMVLLKSTYFKKEIQAFIGVLNSDKFKKKVMPIGNYDFSDAGKIIYP